MTGVGRGAGGGGGGGGGDGLLKKIREMTLGTYVSKRMVVICKKQSLHILLTG